MGRIATKGFLVCALVLASTGIALGQERQISGTVTDAGAGYPLPGVNIAVQGTTQGTTTDINGTYSIRAGSEDVLVFSFVGYVPQEIVVGDRSTIDVALAEDQVLLEEVVVVGYGTQRKEDVTGSVATIDADDANVGLVTSPENLIQGRVAGVSITQNNGEPGSGFNIRIRGGTSISASNEPLYVIDGVPIDNRAATPGGGNVSNSAGRNPLNLINPNDIESISILKDASATAIYGSRGANGVVLITTKGGGEGQLAVDYEGYVATSSAANTLDLLSASDYETFVAEQVDAGNFGRDDDGNIIDDNGNGVADVLDALGSVDTDWQDEVLQTAVSQFHNLAFSGGTSQTRYRASVSYLNQEGIVIDSGLERVTGRLNADHEAFDGRLRLGLNLTTAYTEDDFLPYQQTSGFEGGLFTNVFAFNPTQPVTFDADGDGLEDDFYEIGPGRQSVRNPVALARQVDDTGETTRALGNISAELDLIEGLTAQINVGADRTASTRSQYFPAASPVGAEFNGQALQKSRNRTTVTLQSYLTYNRRLADAHNVDLLAGYEFNEYDTEEIGAEARDFVTDAVGANALNFGGELIPGSCTDQTGTYSCKEQNRLISFFSRANYNLRSKYYLTGVLRYDGSSRFGSGNEWALFPALSGAWRLSEEGFMRGLDAVSDLRLKLGYGRVGSQEIPNLLSLAQLGADPDSRAILGDQIVTGVAAINLANPDLKWEETTSYNVGLDFAFLNGKYSGSLEYYWKETDDLLLQIPVPQPAPVSTFIDNIGSVRNTGVELALDALAIDREGLSLQLGLVFNTNENEILDLGGRSEIFTGTVSGRGQSGTFSQVLREGGSLGTFYGPEFVGIENGREVFNDYTRNEDGSLELAGTTTFDGLGQEDRVVIGNAQPDFTYGLRSNLYWGDFDVAVFLRGEQGRDVFNNTALVYQSTSAITQGQNFIGEAMDDGVAIDEAPHYSSRWIQDGSFLRLENVTVGYTINQLRALTDQVRNARVYLSLQNLFVLTPYDGYDPEVNTNAQANGIPTVGIDYTNYPRPRTVTVGLSLGF